MLFTNYLNSNTKSLNKKNNLESIEIYYVDPYQLTFSNIKSVSNFFKQFKGEICYIKIDNVQKLKEFSNLFIYSVKEKNKFTDIRYVIKVNIKNSKNSKFIYGCRFTFNVNNENFKIQSKALNYILSIIESDINPVIYNNDHPPR